MPAQSIRFYVADAGNLPPAALAMPVAVLQPFVPGTPMSASFLVGPGGQAWLIGVGIQRMAVRDGRFNYLGGTMPVPCPNAVPQLKGRSTAVPGLRVRRCGFHLELREQTCHDPRNQPEANDFVRRIGPSAAGRPSGPCVAYGLRSHRLETGSAGGTGGICSLKASLSFRADGDLLIVAAEFSVMSNLIEQHLPWIALDIGGANIKAAHEHGPARTVPFEVWKRPDELNRAIAAAVAALPPSDRAAVTMTAELCDCYPTKHTGCNAVLDAVHRGIAWLVDRRLGRGRRVSFRGRSQRAAGHRRGGQLARASDLGGPSYTRRSRYTDRHRYHDDGLDSA